LFVNPSEVFLDEIRDGKFIGATGHTLLALGTASGLLNGVCLPSFSQDVLAHPFHHGTQAEDGLDGNILGTGLAVVAPPAEIPVIDLANLLYPLLLLVSQIPTPLKYLPILIEKALMLHTGEDGNPRVKKGYLRVSL
jgi:hypothetical protein